MRVFIVMLRQKTHIIIYKRTQLYIKRTHLKGLVLPYPTEKLSGSEKEYFNLKCRAAIRDTMRLILILRHMA